MESCRHKGKVKAVKTPTQNGIAFLALVMAVGLEIYLFAASRNDPSLRIAALVSGTALVASLGSIASTLLTGKDVTSKADPKELPPGTLTTQSTTVQTPPVTVNPIQPA